MKEILQSVFLFPLVFFSRLNDFYLEILDFRAKCDIRDQQNVVPRSLIRPDDLLLSGYCSLFIQRSFKDTRILGV